MDNTISDMPEYVTSRKSVSQCFRSGYDSMRRWLQRVLFRAAMHLTEEGNCEKAAKRELAAIGYRLDDPEEGPNKWMAENVIDLLKVFSTQGHSGFSASYIIGAFENLAKFKPLTPLTGADSEWNEVSNGIFQNNRNSAVFKDANQFDGQAYYLDGKVFKEPDGVCFTNRESAVPLTFPCTPTTVYVDVQKEE